jgi:hypothetical protein
MSFDYADARDTADELITDFGQAVSLRRTSSTGPVYDPTLTTADYATLAAILDYNSRQIDGENILVTDRRALVAAGPLTALGITSVNAPDSLVVGGVAVPIVRVMPLSPAGTVVMYDCQLRF